MREIFVGVGIGSFSFWRPSRGDTSTILTKVGSYCFLGGIYSHCDVQVDLV